MFYPLIVIYRIDNFVFYNSGCTSIYRPLICDLYMTWNNSLPDEKKDLCIFEPNLSDWWLNVIQTTNLWFSNLCLNSCACFVIRPFPDKDIAAVESIISYVVADIRTVYLNENEQMLNMLCYTWSILFS